jgi:hypothetical protein
MNDNQTLKEILSAVKENREIIDFLKENMATKGDIANMATKGDIANMATKDDLRELKNEMVEHVDGFIALYQKHEVELAAVVSRQNRFEEKLDAVIKHLGLKIV